MEVRKKIEVRTGFKVESGNMLSEHSSRRENFITAYVLNTIQYNPSKKNIQ